MENAVRRHFDGYPEMVRARLTELRSLIIQTASDLELDDVDETLKWGEPSYTVKTGSPIRMDWKPTSPDHCFLFFNCNTKLVDSFREIYGDELALEGNRAIVLTLADPVPRKAIAHCIELALTYKKRKALPLLGA